MSIRLLLFRILTLTAIFCPLLVSAQQNCRTIPGDSAALSRVYPSTQTTITYIIPTVVHVFYDSMNVPNNFLDFHYIDSVINEVNVYLRKENADTSIIASDFRNIIGNPQMELRLARYDTAGNCISGIFYHEVGNVAQQPVQHYQDWQHYFNIYINVPPAQSAGAYATLPINWNQQPGIGTDGIYFVMPGNFITPIVLHEFGHWLGLQHTWGMGPIFTCGDDLVPDTPITGGSNNCDTTLNVCTPGIRENVQNFMDYSSCKHMYTAGQVARMHGILNDTALNRKEISINSNLVATGVLTPPTCAASATIQVAEFPVNPHGCTVVRTRYFICNPQTAVPDSVHWVFQDGIPATSNVGVQLVSFTSTGNKTISMTAYFNGVPQVSTMQYNVPTADSMLTGNGMFFFETFPFTENFENGFALPDGHVRVQAADTTWEIRTGIGYNSDSCLFVRPEHNTGVDTNKIVLGTFNLDTLTNPVLTFYVAASDYANAIDRKIMVRGRQWCYNNRTAWLEVIYDTMMTMSNSGTNFVPSATNQWYKATVNLGGMNLFGNVETEISLMLVKDFRQPGADDYFYLDNISIHDSINGLPPVADFSISDTLFCWGSCNNYIEFVDRSQNLPDHYTWNMTSNILLQNPVLLGDYCFPWDSLLVTLIVSNEYGADTASHWIRTRNIQNLTASADTSVICAGDTVTLTAYGFDPDVTFFWENTTGPNASATLLSQSGYQVQAIPNQQTTTYKVTAVNSLGCLAIRYITITRYTYPGASFTATTNCIGSGSSVALSGQNCSSCTIAWSPANMLNTSSGQFVVTNPLLSSTAFTVSYNLNGCVSTFTDTIHVSDPYPTVNLWADDTLLCPGQQVHFSANTNGGITNYNWSGPPCCIIPFNVMGDSATSTPNGNYWYTVSAVDTNGCVSATDSLYIQTIPTPSFWIHPYNNYLGGSMIRMCLFVDSVALYAQGPPNTTYQWTSSAGSFSQVDDTTVVYHNSIPGISTLTVTATNAAGCVSSQVKAIDKNMSTNEPLFSAAPMNSTICEGDSVLVNITPGNFYYYYFWMNHHDDISGIIPTGPSTGSQGNGDDAWLSPTVSTHFLLTAFDWYTGCSATRTVNVNVNPAPPVVANATDTFVCVGQSVTLTGAGAQTYSWTNSVVNGVPFIPAATQTYTVTGTDAIGCSATDTITVTVDVCLNTNSGSELTFAVYPVPANELLNISNPDAQQLNVVLTDLSGKVVETVSGAGTILQLNTSELSEGMYLLLVNGGDARKIVVSH